MCPGHSEKDNTSTYKAVIGLLSLSTIGLLGATIALAVNDNPPAPPPTPYADSKTTDYAASKSTSLFFDTLGDNTCAGKKLQLDEEACVGLEVAPQSGANVTEGYVGKMAMFDIKPNTKSFQASNMCPVNVHWHLGSEHYSWGQFDENGAGPHGNQPRPDWAQRARDLYEPDEKVRDGFRCHHYDSADDTFTRPYEWQHCIGMEVGETYEVHWPHSSVGDCGTPNQYQTPFYDGVFCNLPQEAFEGLGAQDIAMNVGVHGQIFTIVNDERYFYPDMIRGMIVDTSKSMGQDVAYYTGSTTGTSRDNDLCSKYTPITWQVDRKCHKISASSFDKMCLDMKMQRDDMSGDLHPHGSRELVKHDYASGQYVPEEEVGDGGSTRNLRA